MSDPGDVNNFQCNRKWFFPRRVDFDSWFNVIAACEVSRNEPEIMSCFAFFWFPKEASVIFSSNRLIPWQNGCSQFLVSSRKFYCSICDWESLIFTTIRQDFLFRVESFNMDFRCVHLFQLLKVHSQYVSFPDPPRVQSTTEESSGSIFFPKWWILDWSFVETGL